jgi:hypothetical protein
MAAADPAAPSVSSRHPTGARPRGSYGVASQPKAGAKSRQPLPRVNLYCCSYAREALKGHRSARSYARIDDNEDDEHSARVCNINREAGAASAAATAIRCLALQLPFMQVSESMGNHDSKIVDAASVD